MSEGRKRDSVSQVVGWSRYFIIIAVLGLFVSFMALMVSSAWKIVLTIVKAAGPHSAMTQKQLVATLVQEADIALLATVLYVIALGLYSLFVDDTIPMPRWLRIRTLADLKELLASVVIVVLAVIFLGQALAWDGRSDLLTPGLASAAIIVALAMFLWVSGVERARQEQHDIDEAELRQCRDDKAGTSPE